MKKLWNKLNGPTKWLILFQGSGYAMIGFIVLGGKLFGSEAGGFAGIIIFMVIWLAILLVYEFKAKK